MLTDKDLTIISLLRIVPEGPDQEELRVGLKYSLDNRQNYRGIPNLTRERLKDALQRAVIKAEDDPTVQGKRSKKQQGDSIRKAISASLSEFPPTLIDHAMRLNDFSTDVTPQTVLESDLILDRLMCTLSLAKEITRGITSSQFSKGFIIAKMIKPSIIEANPGKNPEHQTLIYEDFHPFRPKQHEADPDMYILEIEGFNNTVDEFFSSIESQKLESRLTERQDHAKRKLDTARQEHEKRLGGLQQAQQMNVRKAEAIEGSLQKVQEATAAMNGLIAQGMDWGEIAHLIEMEQTKHNPVAEIIKLPLKLYENTVTLFLPKATFNAEDDYEGNEAGSDVSSSNDDGPTKSASSISLDMRLAIDIDLALSPWSNARQYYDQKKTAAVKEQKTIQSSVKALKSTERKINADLNKGLKPDKQILRPVRNQLWFEKYIYFISSEGYLVLAGRDAQQNEIIYKRYLKKGDIYVHADLPSAASVIIKNRPGMLESPIPPSTLSQAGTLAVATSSAWDSKAVMSAWWVRADQVSKTAPTGEYLTTAGFTVKGQKNFLPPAQLLLGFGLMFHISEESKARHMKHRVVEKGTDVLKSSPDEQLNAENEDDMRQPEASTYVSEEAQEDSMMDDADEDSDGEAGKASQKKSYAESEIEVSTHGENDIVDDVEGANPDISEDPGNEEIARAESEAEWFRNQESFEHGRINPLRPQSGGKNEPYKDLDARSANEELSGNDARIEEPRVNGDDHGFVDQKINSSSPTTGNGAIPIRHLAAKERRLLRQGQHSQSIDITHHKEPVTLPRSQNRESPFNAFGSTDWITPLPKRSTKQPEALSVRGKHGKRNKLRIKYANQDEEDRRLALQVLGSAAGQQKVVHDAQAKAAKESELAAQKERRRERHALAAAKNREAEEIRKTNMQEGIETLDEEEVESHGNLDAFVGTVLPGDEILDALVVCGPWDAIGSRCKWKAKLQPGTTKKGKAVREILTAWMTVVTDKEKERRPQVAGDEAAAVEERLSRREGELIKGIREQEVIGTVPVGKCRVILGGGEGKKGKEGGGAGKGRRGGKGSKKQR